MTLPPKLIQLSYNWWTDREGLDIVAIVGHGTAGRDSRAYLSRGGNRPDGSDRKVSIHVLIDKTGTCYRYVPDERGANHAGHSTMTINGVTYSPVPGHINVNQVTLSFELENLQDGRDPYPEAQLLSMGWLIATWRHIHGQLPLVRHGDIDPTRRRDPHQLSVQDMERWVERALKQPHILPPAPRRYRAICDMPIIETDYLSNRIALGGAARVWTNEIVEVDSIRDDLAHLASGVGFVVRHWIVPV